MTATSGHFTGQSLNATKVQPQNCHELKQRLSDLNSKTVFWALKTYNLWQSCFSKLIRGQHAKPGPLNNGKQWNVVMRHLLSYCTMYTLEENLQPPMSLRPHRFPGSRHVHMPLQTLFTHNGLIFKKIILPYTLNIWKMVSWTIWHQICVSCMKRNTTEQEHNVHFFCM